MTAVGIGAAAAVGVLKYINFGTIIGISITIAAGVFLSYSFFAALCKWNFCIMVFNVLVLIMGGVDVNMYKKKISVVSVYHGSGKRNVYFVCIFQDGSVCNSL